MIIIITGEKGDGKTLFMTWLVYLMKGKRRVISNYKLNHVKYEGLSIKKLFDHVLNNKLITKALVCIDEIQTVVDSRKFGSDINLLISYFGLQTRKTEVDLIGTTQNFSMVEKRLRDNTDIYIECKSYEFDGKNMRKLIEGEAKVFQNVIIKASIYRKLKNQFVKVNSLNIQASKIYGMYDTNMVIQLDPMKKKMIEEKIRKNKIY